MADCTAAQTHPVDILSKACRSAGKERADKLAGSGPVEDRIIFDGPLVTALVRENLASRRREECNMLDVLTEKGWSLEVVGRALSEGVRGDIRTSS